MNILQVASRFHPLLGGQKHVLKVSQALQARGHQVSVVTWLWPGQQSDICEMYAGLHIYRVPQPTKSRTWRWLAAWWHWMWQHRDLITGADVVHLHFLGILWYLPFRLLYPNIPVFVTFHGPGSDLLSSYTTWQRTLFLLERRVTERLCAGEIGIGEYLKTWYGDKPDYVLYGGVDGATNHAIPGEPSAVFVGRLDVDTNCREYLHAVDLLHSRTGLLLHTVLLGDGPLRAELEAYCRDKGLRVDFLGWVESVEEIAGRHSFAFASQYLAILEALARGQTVFGYYDSAIKRDCLKSAEFAPLIEIASSPSELADRLVFHLNNVEAGQDLRTSAALYTSQRTWSMVAEVYEKLYHKPGLQHGEFCCKKILRERHRREARW